MTLPLDPREERVPVIRPKRLNVGCGPFPQPGWTNLDRRAVEGVNVVGDVADGLKWIETGCVELVYCGHVLEHMTYDDELPRALAAIRRVLADGGRLMVVGPDMHRAKQSHRTRIEEIWPGDLSSDAPGYRHQWESDVPRTVNALGKAGFTSTEIPIRNVAPPWPVVSRVGWQFALLCGKTTVATG